MGTVKKYENSVHKSNGCIVNKKRYKTMKLEKRCKYSVGKKTDKVKMSYSGNKTPDLYATAISDYRKNNFPKGVHRKFTVK